MPRILVADDNSNIQKMVALALKDEGIDVVAVGNGEAAIRRIPDLRPDLVLADIFMPVRNGYEVCEFVKSDSHYMNTPVVLLVGAFDPLDEQETQRVRADGVLKKPFVPPDPLINMVKALLAKSNGQTPAGMPQPVPAPLQPSAPVQAAPTEPAMPVQRVMPAQRATPAKATTPPPPISAPPLPSSPNEVAVPRAEEAPQLQTKISPPASRAPGAFVNSKASQPGPPDVEDSDEVTTAVRDPNLGDPFWATPAEPQEAEEEPETKPADMLDMHSFGQDEPYEEGEQGPPSHFRPELAPLSAPLDNDDFAVDLQEASGSQPPVGETDPPGNDVVQSVNQEPSAFDLPETPEIFKFDPALTFPPVTQEASLEPASSKPESPAYEAMPHESAVSDDVATPSWPPETSSTAEPLGPDKKSDAEEIDPMELESPSLPDHEAVITAATEAARRAFSELNSLPSGGPSPAGFAENAGAQKHRVSPSAPASAPPSPTPEMIEAVVNRMLERMQPEIMEMVNREVLRPAIEAMVRREMKKS